LLFKIYFGIGVVIGLGLALRDHNGALLLGLGLSVIAILGVEYSRIKKGVRFADYCKFRALYIFAGFSLTFFALAVPFLPKVAF
jgi:hypothetical protein